VLGASIDVPADEASAAVVLEVAETTDGCGTCIGAAAPDGTIGAGDVVRERPVTDEFEVAC